MVELGTVLNFIQAVGIIVGVIYYILNIRVQNKTRNGQLLMQTYGRIDAPGRAKSLVAVLALKSEGYDDFMKKYGPESGSGAWDDFGNVHVFFEGLGAMVRMGYIGIEDVAALIGGGIVKYYSVLEPMKEGMKKLFYPRWCAETEYLYGEIMKDKRSHPEFIT